MDLENIMVKAGKWRSQYCNCEKLWNCCQIGYKSGNSLSPSGPKGFTPGKQVVGDPRAGCVSISNFMQIRMGLLKQVSPCAMLWLWSQRSFGGRELDPFQTNGSALQSCSQWCRGIQCMGSHPSSGPPEVWPPWRACAGIAINTNISNSTVLLTGWHWIKLHSLCWIRQKDGYLFLPPMHGGYLV